MNNEDQYKELDKAKACMQFFDVWLNDFEISNPTSDYFLDPANADDDLVCNI